jgi:DNA-binding transcriptional MerR regulator
MAQKMLRIGALSKLTGVHIETIRYYERAGLTPRAARTSNGRRSYGDADARRLAFIRHARDLGFDLGTIRTLMALQERPQTSCTKISNLAEAQLKAVEQKIAQLRLLRRELSRMIGVCENGVVADCRIIETLARSRGLEAPKPSRDESV